MEPSAKHGACLMSTVYLVDDHAMMRDGLRAVLRASGHQVVGESADPTQALADLQRLVPALALVDLELGQRSGFELLTEVLRRRLTIKIIVLTMSAQPRHVAEALRLGAAGYVLKGASAAELMGAIDCVLKGQRYLAGDVANLAVQGLAARAGESPLDSLSARERQIIVLVVRGASSTEIGSALHLSPKTVDSYRSRLMAKLGVADVPALVRLAIRTGLIDAQEP
jgi:two-component system, NarL family, invasion response regulator UvrY